MPFAPLARCAVTGYARVRRSASEADVGGRDGMGGPCGKEWAHEDVRVPESPSAHICKRKGIRKAAMRWTEARA